MFLSILLLVSNLGLAFNVHYCGDDVSSVSLRTIEIAETNIDECCGVKEQKTQCCNDKVVQFQEKSDNLILKSIVFSPYAIVSTSKQNEVFAFETLIFEKKLIQSYSFEGNSPPFFKLFSQYIFYA